MQESIIGLELSQNQKRVWQFLSKGLQQYTRLVIEANGEKLIYNDVVNAVKKVVDRHEILKTTFNTLPGITYPLQVTGPELTGEVEEFDHSAIADPGKIDALIEEGIQIINDPERQVYWNIRVIKVSHEACILSLVFSSLVADVQSMLNIVYEIEAEYKGDPELRLQGDPYQFSQFSEWHNTLLKEEMEEGGKTAAIAVNPDGSDIKLPFEYADKPKELHDALICFELTDDEHKKVNRLVSKYDDLSAMDVYLSVWQLLLWHYTGATDKMLSGIYMTGRSYEAFETIFGHLATIIPLNPEYDATSSFTGFARQLGSEVSRITEVQEYFLLNTLEADHLSVPDSIPYVFEYHDMTAFGKSTLFNKPQFFNTYDASRLKLICEDDGVTTLFRIWSDGSTVEGSLQEIREKYRITLENVLNDPELSLSQLFLPGASEKPKLLNYCSGALKPATNDTFIGLFERQVRQTPDKTALDFSGKQLTYAELDELTNRIAHWLVKSEGIHKGDCIAIQLKRSDFLIAAVLGIMKAGGVYLPLAVDLPEKRRDFILNNSKSRLLISDAQKQSVHEIKCFTSTALKKEIGRFDDHYTPVEIQPEDPVYTIYTSGSTGAPKGVVISHSSLVNYLNWFKNDFSIGENDHTLLMSSIAFDLSYTSLWPPLVTGGTLFILEETAYFDPAMALNYLSAHNITYMKATPSHFNMLVNSSGFDEKASDFSLRWIVLGGEKIMIDDLETYYQYNKTPCFVNHYGPTETTIGVLTQTVSYESFEVFKAKPLIGRPIANTRVFILDEEQNPVSVGVSGEIGISGHGLAVGYLNNPELTDALFIRNPSIASQRIYRTGDLGRMLPGGKVEFLGRMDDQLKVRGHRIELGEIESVLRSQDTIEQAVVLLDKTTSDEDSLIAFYTSSHPADHHKILNTMKEWLPAYMLPASLIYVKAFPLTQNGKIDKRELMKYAVRSRQKTVVLPNGSTEEALLQIWQEVLGKDEISTDDNFMDTGGHSLKAVQVLSRILKELQVKIELKDIFTYPTIQDLGTYVKTLAISEFKAIPVLAKQDHYELSNNQKRLWVLDQFKESKMAYNRPSGYYFENLDTAAFEKAYAALVERHESLRTNIVMVDGVPKQKIDEKSTPDYQLIDVRGNEYLRRIEEIRDEEVNKPFDLSKDPLIRAKLIKYDEVKYLFLFTIHHITSDGWSVEIISNEMMRLYEAFSSGKENPLKPLHIHYKEYASWLNAWLDSEEARAHEVFWKTNLSGTLPRLSMPVDYPRKSVKSYNGDYLEFTVDETEMHILKDLVRSKGGSLFMGLLAALNVMFYRLLEAEDIIIGTVDAGRNHPDLENQVGFYINNLVLRNKVKSNYNFDQILSEVVHNTLEVYKHKMYPFDKIIENLALSRNLNRFPLFDIVLSVQNADPKEYALEYAVEDIGGTYFDTGFVQSVFDLIFDIREIGNELYVLLYYNSDLFRKKTIEKIKSSFVGTIKTVTGDPFQPIHEIDTDIVDSSDDGNKASNFYDYNF